MTAKGAEALKEGSATAIKTGGRAAKQVWGMAESTGKQVWQKTSSAGKQAWQKSSSTGKQAWQKSSKKVGEFIAKTQAKMDGGNKANGGASSGQ
jgi:hypothetical protein